MELVSAPAVVIDVSAVAGKDRLLTFLTRNHGKVRLFARRIARRAPATAYYEALQGGELTFVRTNENAAGRLFSFTPQRVWPGIRGDFDRILQALAFLELVNLCATEGESQPELFDLFVQFLNRLESDDQPETVRVVATLRLLRIVGFDPHLDHCLACGAAPAPRAPLILSPAGGGLLCRTCAAARREPMITVSAGAYRFMLRALHCSAAQVRRLRAGAVVAREVSRLLEAFLEARLEVRPRAVPFLEALRSR